MIGCAFGLGLGLDPKNRVTLVKPGGPTAATGKIEVVRVRVRVRGRGRGRVRVSTLTLSLALTSRRVGDRILTVDGADLMGREMQHVIRPADKHVLGVWVRVRVRVSVRVRLG